MQKQWKRGFTTPELVIVIVVIVILAAVLIPTFVILATDGGRSTDDPDTAADIALARNMNDVLAETAAPASMSDLVPVLAEHGYRLDNLSPVAEGNVFVWNKTTNRISYLGSDGTVLYTEDVLPTVFTPSPDFWLAVRSAAEMEAWSGLSYYLAADITEPLVFTRPSSLNTGGHMAGDVTYRFEGEGTVTVEGALSSLVVEAPQGTVHNYSSVGGVALLAGSEVAYHEHGYVRGTLSVAETFEGGVAVEAEGTIVELEALNAPLASLLNRGYILTLTRSDGVTVLNEGYIGNAEENGIENAASLTYSIANASALARLRDKINNGICPENVTYVLTGDIDLTGSDWVPMGLENARFQGTFDGGGHTIKGLSNLCLFGFVDAGSTVRDIVFTQVNTILPPVAACVYGSTERPTTFSGIEVNGVVSSDIISVSGLVGILRSAETELPTQMKDSPEVVIENCVSNVTATCVGYTRAAGFVVTVYGVNLTVRNCVNNGDLSVTNHTREAHAGGIVGFIMDNSLLEAENADPRCENFTVTIENCSNHGAVATHVGMAADGYAGGIVGACFNGRLVVTGCMSDGAVSSRNSVGGGKSAAGGIVGRSIGNAVLTDCESRGSVTATAERAGTDIAAGGAVGFFEINSLGGTLELTRVSVSGSVAANGQGEDECIAGGLLAKNLNQGNRLTISECTVSAQARVTASGAEANYAAAVIGRCHEKAPLTILSVTVAEGAQLIGDRETQSLGLVATPVEGGYVRYTPA